MLTKNLRVRNSNICILRAISREKATVEKSPEPHGPIPRVTFSLGPVTVEPLVGNLEAALGLVMTLALWHPTMHLCDPPPDSAGSHLYAPFYS